MKALKKTPLFEETKKMGARMGGGFAGWNLPLYFSDPKTEHLHTRSRVSLFDVSNMGEIRIEGEGAVKLLSFILTAPVLNLKDGQCRYALMCNKSGGIIDDLIVYKESPSHFILCVNAAHIEKDFLWIKEKSPSFKVKVLDESPLWGQMALQGPQSLSFLSDFFDVSNIKKFHFDFFSFKGEKILISRTGYTGEEGFEILCPAQKTPKLWQSLLSKNSLTRPAGLLARDTLRLEMKYPLCGQDMNEDTTPLEMGLLWACKNPHDFIGKNKISSGKKRWMGFEILQSPSGVPRTGCPIFSKENKKIGRVTSGALSPSLNKMIGMGMFDSPPADECFIEIHSEKIKAKANQGPFIKR